MAQPTLNSVTVDYLGVGPAEYAVSVPTNPYKDIDGVLVDRYSFKFTDRDGNGEIGIDEMPPTVLSCSENYCSDLDVDVPSTDRNVLAAVKNASQGLKQLIGGLNLKQQMKRIADLMTGETPAMESMRFVVSVGRDCSKKQLSASRPYALDFYYFDIEDVSFVTQGSMHLEGIAFDIGTTHVEVRNTSPDTAALYGDCRGAANFSHKVSSSETGLNKFLNQEGRTLQVYWR